MTEETFLFLLIHSETLIIAFFHGYKPHILFYLSRTWVRWSCQQCIVVRTVHAKTSREVEVSEVIIRHHRTSLYARRSYTTMQGLGAT